jgi:hypothetical protein
MLDPSHQPSCIPASAAILYTGAVTETLPAHLADDWCIASRHTTGAAE